MWGRIVKIALSLPFLIAAGLFGLYLVFGFFLVDPLAQKLLPWIGENKLASQLSVRHVKFNPLTLEATVDGLKLAEQNGAPLASFERLYVNLDTTGLFRWAWRIRDIELDQPHAAVGDDRAGTDRPHPDRRRPHRLYRRESRGQAVQRCAGAARHRTRRPVDPARGSRRLPDRGQAAGAGRYAQMERRRGLEPRRVERRTGPGRCAAGQAVAGDQGPAQFRPAVRHAGGRLALPLSHGARLSGRGCALGTDQRRQPDRAEPGTGAARRWRAA